MPDSFLDRRRTPRVTVAAGHELAFPTSLTMQVLDIGLNGALLSSPEAIAVGRRAHLRTMLGSAVFEADVEICRIAAGRDDGIGRFRLGARFIAIDDENRQKIQRFLSTNELCES